LKNFWPKWKWDCYKFFILKYGLNDNLNSEDIFNEVFKTNNKNDIQTGCIYISKVNDLIQIKVDCLFFFHFCCNIIIENLNLLEIWISLKSNQNV
jgi:hypothetical protein